MEPVYTKFLWQHNPLFPVREFFIATDTQISALFFASPQVPFFRHRKLGQLNLIIYAKYDVDFLTVRF